MARRAADSFPTCLWRCLPRKLDRVGPDHRADLFSHHFGPVPGKRAYRDHHFQRFIHFVDGGAIGHPVLLREQPEDPHQQLGRSIPPNPKFGPANPVPGILVARRIADSLDALGWAGSILCEADHEITPLW